MTVQLTSAPNPNPLPTPGLDDYTYADAGPDDDYEFM